MAQISVMTAESIQHYVNEADGSLRLDLYIKNVTCGHCIQKITREIEFHPHLNHFEFEAGGKRLSLWSTTAKNLQDLLQSIQSIGFDAIPLTSDTHESLGRQQFKEDLKKMAVAGVCAGNIMLFSVAIYFGADEEFKRFFDKLSLFLVLPVLFYSASSIWFGVYQGIKNLKFNLDMPIGMALFVGMTLSLLSFFNQGDAIFFDSIAVIVFLILTSRFVLNRYVNSVFINNIVQFVPGAYQARVIEDSKERVVGINDVKVGDEIRVKRGEVCPVDGRLSSESAIFDLSVINGEFEPVMVQKGEMIFAGSTLSAGVCDVTTFAVGKKTRVGQSIERAQALSQKRGEESYVYVSRFTLFVLMMSLLTFVVVFYSMDFVSAYQRAFAIILVACPCAISFGIPLIRSFSGQLSLRHGIVTKDPRTLKGISRAKDIFLDKTGTLTQSSLEVSGEDFKKFSVEDQLKILSLELSMDHPVSRGFKKFAKNLRRLPVTDFQYHPGRGISGVIEGQEWSIETGGLEIDKQLIVSKAQIPIGSIRVHSSLKSGLTPFFEALAKMKYRISILSGDNEVEVNKISRLVPSASRGVFLSSATPEQKRQAVASVKAGTLMVGDGINDIEAMKAASLSVCMPGALENNMNVADVTLVHGDLASILNIFKISKKIDNTEKRLLRFTFCYNLLCILLASFGFITPIAAAILMPLSSVSVLSLVVLNLRKL